MKPNFAQALSQSAGLPTTAPKAAVAKPAADDAIDQQILSEVQDIKAMLQSLLGQEQQEGAQQ